MAEQAEALIAVWDGVSQDTSDMIDVAELAGLKIHVHQIDGTPAPKKQQEFAL